MIVGYARISTDMQDLEMQKTALEKAGCETIFMDVASGAKRDRIELINAINSLKAGDTLVVWKLDRLTRSIKDLINFIEKLAKIGAKFRSLTEVIDTSTAAGNMQMQIIGVFAEFERNLIRERTKAGIESARARGKIVGRPRKLDFIQRQKLTQMFRTQTISVVEIANLFNIHRASVYRLLLKDDFIN